MDRKPENFLDFGEPQLYVSANVAGAACVVPAGTPGAIAVPQSHREPRVAPAPAPVHEPKPRQEVAPRRVAAPRSRERRGGCNTRTRGSRRTGSRSTRAGPDDSDPHESDPDLAAGAT
jgi:hypothetical protein